MLDAAATLEFLSAPPGTRPCPRPRRPFDPLIECPSEVDQKQFDGLGIDLNLIIKAIKAKRQEKQEPGMR